MSKVGAGEAEAGVGNGGRGVALVDLSALAGGYIVASVASASRKDGGANKVEHGAGGVGRADTGAGVDSGLAASRFGAATWGGTLVRVLREEVRSEEDFEEKTNITAPDTSGGIGQCVAIRTGAARERGRSEERHGTR